MPTRRPRRPLLIAVVLLLAPVLSASASGPALSCDSDRYFDESGAWVQKYGEEEVAFKSGKKVSIKLGRIRIHRKFGKVIAGEFYGIAEKKGKAIESRFFHYDEGEEGGCEQKWVVYDFNGKVLGKLKTNCRSIACPDGKHSVEKIGVDEYAVFRGNMELSRVKGGIHRDLDKVIFSLNLRYIGIPRDRNGEQTFTYRIYDIYDLKKKVWLEATRVEDFEKTECLESWLENDLQNVGYLTEYGTLNYAKLIVRP